MMGRIMPMSNEGTTLHTLFHPRTIAVAGMSTSRRGPANRFVSDLRDFGFDGQIFAIHPSATEIDGVPAYSSFAEVPTRINYAFIAVAAAQATKLLEEVGGNVDYAQVMSSGFGETGSAKGLQMEKDLVRAARDGGARVLGPNCLGTYSPQGRMTFVAGVPSESGVVGVVSQSGGLAIDFMRRGSRRGLRFSGVVTVGNSADIDPADLLAHYLADDETQVIGLYLETARQGRRLFELLLEARGRKPCVLLKGGRSEQGSRAAASHTGALASDDRIWVALCEQTGAILAESLDEFIDVLTCLQHLCLKRVSATRDIALVGNGGGTSVLATDALSRVGLRVGPFAEETILGLEALSLPPGTSVLNPVDTPATTVLVRDGEVMQDILRLVASDSATDALIAHANLAVLLASTDRPAQLLDNLFLAIHAASNAAAEDKHVLAVLRSDGDPPVEAARSELTERLRGVGVPVLHELTAAGTVLQGVRQVEEVWAQRDLPQTRTTSAITSAQAGL